MFKMIGKFIKAIFGAGVTMAQAVENTAGSANEMAYAMRQATEVVSDNIVQDLKIDSQIDDIKRERKLAKAQAKTARIKAEIAEIKAG